MTAIDLMKRRELSYIPLENIATAINNGCNASLTGSDIFQYLTDVAGITYDADQQGVVSHLGFVLDTLSELSADDIDICYCFGVDYDDEDRQGIVDSIARLHRELDDNNTWHTVLISENGE